MATEPEDRDKPPQGVNFNLLIHRIHTGENLAAKRDEPIPSSDSVGAVQRLHGSSLSRDELHRITGRPSKLRDVPREWLRADPDAVEK